MKPVLQFIFWYLSYPIGGYLDTSIEVVLNVLYWIKTSSKKSVTDLAVWERALSCINLKFSPMIEAKGSELNCLCRTHHVFNYCINVKKGHFFLKETVILSLSDLSGCAVACNRSLCLCNKWWYLLWLLLSMHFYLFLVFHCDVNYIIVSTHLNYLSNIAYYKC